MFIAFFAITTMLALAPRETKVPAAYKTFIRASKTGLYSYDWFGTHTYKLLLSDGEGAEDCSRWTCRRCRNTAVGLLSVKCLARCNSGKPSEAALIQNSHRCCSHPHTSGDHRADSKHIWLQNNLPIIGILKFEIRTQQGSWRDPRLSDK